MVVGANATRHRRRCSGGDDRPGDHGCAGDDRCGSRPGDHRCGRPGDHCPGNGDDACLRPCRRTSAELDAEATSNINPQPRDSLQQGGTLRQYVSSLADNWNPNHPDGNQLDFTQVRQPMSYFPFIFDAEATRPSTLTSCRASKRPRTS